MSHNAPETLLYYGPKEEVKESSQTKRKTSHPKNLSQDASLNIKDTLNSSLFTML